MNLNTYLLSNLFQKCLKPPTKVQIAKIYNRSRIGNREWVGFGMSGTAVYEDSITCPFPAIRYRENTNELLALREKEKGDWRKLSIEEKKTLYRASFERTFCEICAPTGEWKKVAGVVLLCLSCGLWIFILNKLFIYGPRSPSLSDEYRKATLRRILDLKMGHLSGLPTKWDYEKDDWK